ncbi:S26 family signal peptidase [Ilumatobacter sp.]|uniref:S26 family signal peptidase n=1 Tax=Ilumatobacter sp. TaxID=1967498 RepID=UPI003C452B44
MTSHPPGRRAWPLRRFVVADRSMEPTLVAGQGLIGFRSGRVKAGELRCVEHPDRSGFWLVKRVTDVDGATMSVASDNDDVPTVDSRQFGPVRIDGSYRVIVRIPRRWM